MVGLAQTSGGRLISGAGGVLLGMAAVCGGQTAAPALRVTTRLVSVDVVVQDGSGHVVSGLTAKDFVVKENGREQRIRAFEDRTTPATADAARTGARRYQFSNLPEATGNGAVTLILFDLLNTPTAEQPFARKELTRFFEHMPAGTRCGLYTLGSHVRVVQTVTANRNELLAGVGRLVTQPADLVRDESDRQAAADQTAREASARGRSPAPGGNAPLREGVISYQERAGNTEEALSELTQAAAGFSGRKNLIWLAGSFPVGIGPSLQTDTVAGLPRTLELPGARDNTAAIAGSEIAIYPISTRGMASTAVGADVSGEAEADSSGRAGIRTIEGQVNRQFDLQVAMEHLASQTGGRAFYNTNDLAGALTRSVDEGSHTYRLDYAPENKRWNGAYRHIAVSVPGRGMHLAYRQGYFATADAQPEAASMPDLGAVTRRGGLEMTGVLLRANVAKPRAAGGETTVDVVVDPASVTFVTGPDGLRHAKLLLLLTAATADGAAGPEKRAVLNIGLEPADYQSVLANGVPVRQTIGGIAPGSVLQVAVRDLQTGQMGTLRLQ